MGIFLEIVGAVVVLSALAIGVYMLVTRTKVNLNNDGIAESKSTTDDGK